MDVIMLLLGAVCFSTVRVTRTLLAMAALAPSLLLAQSPLQQPSSSSKPTPSTTIAATPGAALHAKMNQLADLSRAGNTEATTELTRQTFLNSGIQSEIADSFGFTNRIVKAEAAFQNGVQPAIHEADIVNAVNNLANTVGAPTWVRTNQVEVRKWRMRLLATYPRLIASHEPPDANGRYKALSDNMRPVEASYIALSLLYQKHYNADFQFTDEEQAENAKLDAQIVKTKHLQRIQEFGRMIRGHTSSGSTRDLLVGFDHFFDDLGLGAAEDTTPTRAATPKGDR
jgi:hypothetical protein